MKPETATPPPGLWQSAAPLLSKRADWKQSGLESLFRSAYEDSLRGRGESACKELVQTCAWLLVNEAEQFVARWIEEAERFKEKNRIPNAAFLALLIEAIEARKAGKPNPNTTRTKSPDWRARYLNGIFKKLEKQKGPKDYRDRFRVFMTWLIDKHKVSADLPVGTTAYLYHEDGRKGRLKAGLEFAQTGKKEPSLAVRTAMLSIVGDDFLVKRFDEGDEWKRIALLALRTAFLDQHKLHVEAIRHWYCPARDLEEFLVTLGDEEYTRLFDKNIGPIWLIPSVCERLKAMEIRRQACRRHPEAKTRRRTYNRRPKTDLPAK